MRLCCFPDPRPAAAPASRPPLRLLVVGAPLCPALGRAVDAARSDSRVTLAEDAPQAERRLLAGEAFDATLLLAPTPRRHASSARETLAAAGGAGEIVTVGGVWCEGQRRFQPPAADPSLIYWHELAAWLRGLRNEADAPDTPKPSGAPKQVVVASRDRDAAAALADGLREHGVSVVWRPRGGKRPLCTAPDAGVWIGGQLNGPETLELAGFCRRLRGAGAATVALLDFPRDDELQTARAVGAAVLPKPYGCDELLMALAAETAAQQQRTDDRRGAA